MGRVSTIIHPTLFIISCNLLDQYCHAKCGEYVFFFKWVFKQKGLDFDSISIETSIIVIYTVKIYRR